ncbi:MAG: hypothetical protein EOO05_20175, partial [Chitinophagaceae bacterium]
TDPATSMNKGDSVVEFLVKMAYNNPRIRSLENVAVQSDYEVSRSKSAWLNQITVAGNLNEVSVKRTFNNDPILVPTNQYPRYNLGVVLPIGIFVNNKKATKALEHQYESNVNQVEMERIVIKRQVVSTYEDYLLYQSLITLQQEALQDAQVLYTKAEEAFEKGKMTLEAFTQASKSFNAEKVREINLRHSLALTMAEMESLIGMDLTDALKEIYERLR